jgi:hypothetical protein
MTEQDNIVLNSLADAWRRFNSKLGPEFLRPMDFGRSRGGALSASLKRLEKAGLVQSRRRTATYYGALPSSRPHYEYRITDAGLAECQRPKTGQDNLAPVGAAIKS